MFADGGDGTADRCFRVVESFEPCSEVDAFRLYLRKSFFGDVKSRYTITCKGKRDGYAAAARPNIEDAASRRDVLLHKTNQLLRLWSWDEYARTDEKLASAKLLTAQNILHGFAFGDSIDNYLQLRFVICL